MIDRLISFTLNNRLLTGVALLLLIVGGLWSFSTLPMDSFPDVSNVQVQIITEPESMATDEVESLITVPIETAMSGLPGISLVRSNSSFGLSVVTVIFHDNVDIYFARQLVQQRLLSVPLPDEAPSPQLGPVVSTFSNVLMYYLEGEGNSTDLRTLQDWTIARALKTVPGVANVVSYGGFVKQYQVMVDPDRLRAYNLTLEEVVHSLQHNNSNAGGNFIVQAGEEIIIRGLGRIEAADDIGNIVLKEENGTPVKLAQVATIQIGGAFRRGSAHMNGKEAVTGIVMTRRGTNTKQVVLNAEEKLKQIASQLPPGVKIVTYYNQMELVDKTMETVREILFFSAGLVLIVLTGILLHVRAAVIAALVIPLSLLFSFIMMKFSGLSANLMTLGAVDFGVIVDAGVVMVENIFRRVCAEHHINKGFNAQHILEITRQSAIEVGKPILFAILIIISVYIPLFALEGVEGKMFAPLALTFIYALIGALVCSLTFIPLFCAIGFRGSTVEKENRWLNKLISAYRRVLRGAIEKPVLVIACALSALVLSLCLIPFLGSEFIPSLDEGSILLRTKLAASVSHDQAIEIADLVERIACSHPEVETAISRIGRSGMGSDLEGVDNADVYIGLRPRSEWKQPSKEALIAAMSEQLDRIPGLSYSFSQPIADMVDDLVSGVKADVAVKVYGEDLETIDRIAAQIKHTIKNTRGSADVQREHLLGLPELDIKLNRSALARYGLNVSTVQQYIDTALAGKVVTSVFEGSKRFGVLVRFPKQNRDTIDDIGNMLIATPNGARIPVKSIAELKLKAGTVAINRENGQRRTAVLANVRGRDLGSFVLDAQRQIASSIKIPQGFRVEWGGQFENQVRAMQRLSIVVPVVLFLIFLLLFGAFNSLSNAALVIMNVPFAIIGGVIALLISRQPISVPAIIGFIALFGVAVQNGVILISYIQQLVNEGYDLDSAVEHGAIVRVRPVLMTAMVAIMGLLPKMFSTGTGAEVQRPMAAVMLGGLVSATILTLVLLPVAYRLVQKRLQKKESTAQPAPQVAHAEQ